jgi:Cu/Ag efflux protein CusF
MMKYLTMVLLAAALLPATADAQAPTDHTAHHSASAIADALTEGEVRKVDKDAQKITLRHGPIPNLDMPAMTMVFRVRDAAVLDALKQGDKVKFSASKSNGVYTVESVEVVK